MPLETVPVFPFSDGTEERSTKTSKSEAIPSAILYIGKKTHNSRPKINFLKLVTVIFQNQIDNLQGHSSQ